MSAHHQAKSENESDEELDEIAKLLTNDLKFAEKIFSASLYLVSQFDSAPEWVHCNICDSFIHLMCEATPDLAFEYIKHMPSYECLNCQSYSAQDVYKYVDHQLEHLQLEKHSLDVENLALSDIWKMYSQEQENSMGDGEKNILSILHEVGLKRQAEHGNVFVGNHCKVILPKDKNQVFNFAKLFSVLTDEVAKDHFVELFRIYSEAHSLMAWRHLLSENEKVTLKSLCYNFGALFPVYFPKSTLT